MARIRSIKPEFWRDRKLARQVSRDARLLYVALWNQADEHGRCDGDVRLLKGSCFPYDDDLDLDEIESLLTELANSGRVVRYEVDGDPYLHLPKLGSHQRLEPAKVPSRLPEPPASTVCAGQNPSADSSAPRADQFAPDTDRDALSYVAGSMEQVAGSRGVALAPLGVDPEDDPTGRLLIEHVHAYSEPPPLDAQRAVKTAIMRQVALGEPPERIRAGLARMREKRVAVSLLPQLIAECSPVERPSTTDRAVATGMELVRHYESQESA